MLCTTDKCLYDSATQQRSSNGDVVLHGSAVYFLLEDIMQHTIESVDKDTFERVWKIVEEIGVQERHFNGLQTSYRNMASAWLLAAFGAIGFVLSQKFEVAVDRELLITAIAAAGAIGIALLWIADLLVYHRLLDSCFIEGLILEERYPWLPPFRGNMMRTQEGQGVLFRTVSFYLGPIVLLVLISVFELTLWCYREKWFLAAALLFLAGVIAALFIGRVIRSKTENTAAIEKRLVAAREVEDSK